MHEIRDNTATLELQKLDQSLQELTCAIKNLPKPAPEKSKSLSAILELSKLIIPSLVLFGVTYWIKDSVDMALHERQLQLDYVKTMGTLAAAMQAPALTPQDATNDAIQLAAFGKYSIPFFIHVLEGGNQNSIAGASEGLHMVSMTEPDEVCRQLALVISNRSGLYKWTTHLAAMQLLGEAGCGSATHTVENYLGSLTLDNLQAWVSPQPVPNPKEFNDMKNQADKTLKVLQRVTASATK
jgi:hypothetical protein